MYDTFCTLLLSWLSCDEECMIVYYLCMFTVAGAGEVNADEASLAVNQEVCEIVKVCRSVSHARRATAFLLCPASFV